MDYATINFHKSLNAWGTPEFNAALKKEIEQLQVDELPLQQGLTISSHATDKQFTAMVIGASDERDHISARVGIFYTGVIAGCSCEDDPTPINTNCEYCVVQFDIDKTNAVTTAILLAE